MTRNDDPIDCPSCGKEMRRRWAWWPYCSASCELAQSAHDDQGDEVAA